MARQFNRSRVNISNIPGRVRQTQWSSIGPVQVTDAAGGATLLTALTAVGLALRPFTVVRTRGVMQLFSDQGAAIEPQWVAYGACVVSEQAQAIGVTAVPTPNTDQESDLFFVHQWIANHSSTSIDAQGARFLEYDSKAMRKVQEGEQLITVSEVVASTISEGVVFAVTERQLFKLH